LRIQTIAALFFPLLLSAQSTLPIPGNLKVEGLPAIPMSLVKEVGRYSESRGAGVLDWHPKRREVLITTRFGDVPHLHHVAMPMGARTQLTFGSERVSGGQFEPTLGEFMVFSQDAGGGEWFQLYRQDLLTGGLTLLTDGTSRNQSAKFSFDGRWISYSSTHRNRKDTDIWVMDPRRPESARMVLEVDGGGWDASDWSRDGKKLLVGEYRSIADSDLYLVDVGTGAKEKLTSQKASYGSSTFGADGKGLYLTTDLGSEFQRLAYLDLRTKVITFLRPNLKWDVESLSLSRDGKKLAFTVNEAGISRLHVMNTATRQELKPPLLPIGNFGGAVWHANSRELAVSLNSAKGPSDVYSLELSTQKVTRWTQSETGGLVTDTYAEPELVKWKSFDGLELSGFLYRPAPTFKGARPVILNIHGGPEGQSTPGFMGRINYFLQELGVAVLFPNVRGSTGYGKTFLSLDNGLKREDSVKDIGALLDWIGTRKDLDASRVMVTGASYGGYMTLACMTHFSDRLRCGLDVVGISHFGTFLKNTEAYRRDLRRAEYGDERDPQMQEFFERIAPLNNMGKITKPMFIVQGKNDPRVPVTEATQMVEALRKAGKPIWYLEASDEGHGFSKKKNVDFQFAATVLFIQEFLLKF